MSRADGKPARRRRAPGPRAELSNPYGTAEEERPSTEWIAAADLDLSERELRAYFKAHRSELSAGSGESFDQAMRRIKLLCHRALHDTAAGWWSGRQRVVQWVSDEAHDAAVGPPMKEFAGWRWITRHVGPALPLRSRPKYGCMWLDTSVSPNLLKEYVRPKSWRVSMQVRDLGTVEEKVKWLRSHVALWSKPGSWLEWKLPRTLDTTIRRMIASPDELGRAARSGRPAYLACATLGALLDVTPEKIADLLNNFRHRRRRATR